MDPGKLRELITIQQKQQSGTGDRGQPVYSWVTFTQAYAELEPLPPTGRKTEIARQLYADATHAITLRYITGLTPQMRCVDSAGQIYNFGYVAKGQDASRYFWHKVLATAALNGI